MNPLLEAFNTPYDTAPFDRIKVEHYRSAFAKAIEQTRNEISEITDNPEKPTFSNTCEALDASGEVLDRVSSILFNLNSAETNDDLQSIARDVSPKLSELGNDITMNVKLYERVKHVYDSQIGLDLNVEQRTLLEKQFSRFRRNGAGLSDKDQNELRDLDSKLSQLSLKFGENVLAASNDYELHITDESKISGLPDGPRSVARDVAEERGKDGLIFTLQYPSYIPFMTYVNDRGLREQMYRAFSSRAYEGEYSNQEIVLEIANLRYKRAKLLGYASHAHYVLEKRMALSPDKVQNFSVEILEKAMPAAERDHQELSDYAATLGADLPLQKWDAAYYSEKLKQHRYKLDEEQLKPYFKLDSVLSGAFSIAEKLYGITFTEVHDIPKYHEDVATYVVHDGNNRFMAVFYADFFPREGKRDGAWMTVYKRQHRKDEEEQRPHISIVCNFTPPGNDATSLLRFNEVTTLFHEFGHALHGILADTTYRGLSGTSVLWDFVELPSQILENWCYEREALELFAHHYKTAELIPDDLIQKIKEASNYQEGLQTLRQLSFGMLDMSWHSIDPSSVTSVRDFELKTFKQTDLYPDVEGSCMSTAFSHIFQGGYSAGYYSYKWAEVLDADAFEVFKEKGIFDRETATKFKDTVLSRGGTEEPMLLYKRFRGSEPQINALLKRAGLITPVDG